MASILQIAQEYLNTFRSFVIDHDIPHAINCGSNYLAALGLSTYTETLGGLYCGNLKGIDRVTGKRVLAQNYLTFINDFFHASYMVMDNQLSKDGLKGLYSAVRSGLTHEYFIKGRSGVFKNSSVPINCAILYPYGQQSQIIFVVEQYFADFKKAFESYAKKVMSDSQTLQNFHEALKSINSPFVSGLP